MPLRSMVAAFLLLLSSNAHAASSSPPVLIRDVAVFDGERSLSRRSVLIRDGRIADANHRGAVPANVQIVEGAGKTLLPGLIDSHVHAFQSLDDPLLFGVTTQLDMFTSVEAVQPVRAKMAKGENFGAADIFTAGVLATAPKGHGTQFGMAIPTLTTPEEADAWVAARVAEGSDYIKIVDEPGKTVGRAIPTLDAATIRALIKAAQARGKLAVVHSQTLAGATSAIEAGADGLVHLFIDTEGGPAFARLAKERDVFIVSTFSVFEAFAGRAGAAPLLDQPGLAGLLPKSAADTLRRAAPKDRAAALDVMLTATVSSLVNAGVPILAGTDAGNPGTWYGISMHRELELLVTAGLTPAQALTAATAAPARAFRLKDRGRIANGMKADLLMVDGDPTADIRAVHAISEIWKDGVSARPLLEARRTEIVAGGGSRAVPVVALPVDGRIGLFSDAGGKAVLKAPFGLGWSSSTDAIAGGKSSVDLTVAGVAPGGHPALVMTGEIKPDFFAPWAGVAFAPGDQPFSPANLNAASAIRFQVRGEGGSPVVMGFSLAGGQAPSVAPIKVGREWSEVTVGFSEMQGFDPAGATLLLIGASQKPGPFRLEIADVRLIRE